MHAPPEAALDARDLGSSALVGLNPDELPVAVSALTESDIAAWRLGCHNAEQLDAHAALGGLKVATYTGKEVTRFACAVAGHLHDAQQVLAFDAADQDAADNLAQIQSALLQQSQDACWEVLRQHPALTTRDGYLDPVFFASSQHIFGAHAVLQEFAAKHDGAIAVSAHCGATASALSAYLPSTPGLLQKLTCDGATLGKTGQVTTAQGAAILQAVAVAQQPPALTLTGSSWAGSLLCERALAQCTHLRSLHLIYYSARRDNAGCVAAINHLTNLTHLTLGQQRWSHLPRKHRATAAARPALHLPALQALETQHLPAAESSLPQLTQIKQYCANYFDTSWAERSGGPENALVGPAFAAGVHRAELIVPVYKTHTMDPYLTDLPAISAQLQCLIVRCPHSFRSEMECFGSGSSPGDNAVCRGLVVQDDGSWVRALAKVCAALPQLRRFEHHTDNTLMSAAAAAFFANRTRGLRHLSVVMLPGIASKPCVVQSAGGAGQQDGASDALPTFQASLAYNEYYEVRALELEEPSARLCAMPALRQLAFVQPRGLECQRHLPDVLALPRLEVYSVTQEEVWRGALPGGWGDPAGDGYESPPMSEAPSSEPGSDAEDAQ